MSTQWHDLYAQRHVWALEGHASYVDNLDPYIKEVLGVRSTENIAEKSVVVFGSTQVGKTTLILKLLGVADQELPTVQRILRGGREKGSSSTATALRYQRSPDNEWRIGPTKQPWTDTEALEQFTRIRATMTEGELDTELLDIQIPSRHFCDTSLARLNTVNLSLIDLPGHDAANTQEREHVARLAKNFIPKANLVLLVGSIDDLSFLWPERLVIEQLRDWIYFPSLYRVVTTHTFSMDSMKRWMTTSERSTTDLRQKILEEFSSIDHHIEQVNNKSFVFPLEFGESWQALEKTDPVFFKRVEPVVNSFWNELYDVINIAGDAYSRLRHAFQLAHMIEIQIGKEADNFNTQLYKYTQRLQLKTNQLQRLERAIQKQNNNVCEQRKKWDLLKEKFPYLLNPMLIKNPSLLAYKKLDLQILQLRQELIETKREIKEYSKDKKQSITSSIINIFNTESSKKIIENIHQSVSISEACWLEYSIIIADENPIFLGDAPKFDPINKLVEQLESYTSNTYFKNITKSFSRDINNSIKTLEKYHEFLIEEAKKYILYRILDHILKLKIETERSQKIIANLIIIRKRIQIEEQAFTEKIEALKNNHNNFLKKMETQKKYGENFEIHMKTHHALELERIDNKILTESNPEEIFLQAAFKEVLISEFNKFTGNIYE